MAIKLSPAQTKVLATVVRAALMGQPAPIIGARERRSLMIAYDKIQQARAVMALSPVSRGVPRQGSEQYEFTPEHAKDMLEEAADWQRAHP